jgi:sugar lactone lactonase YvrE
LIEPHAVCEPALALRRLWLGVLIVVLALAAYLLLWPVAFDPVAWTPPPAPPSEPNSALAKVERLGKGLPGPEGIAIDQAGRIHAGLVDGRIVRIGRDGSAETIANTGGRPLGMQFDAGGRLIVCDGKKGLLSIAQSGEITVLATEYGGRRFGFADDLDIARDGTIYFSDASDRFGVHDFRNDAFEHRPNGRLLAWHPDGRTELVKDGLYFANGVALSSDESYVLVSETWEYRLTRIWLTGDKKGSSDVFAVVPGFPDNITRSPSGDLFWVALFAPRAPDLDAMAGRPFLRKLVARLPTFLQPAPVRHAFVLGIDAAGSVVHDLQDPSSESYSPITSALEHDGKLYLGSLWREQIASIDVPPAP